ncbi:MAG: VWA domain-containing protein [Myxococcales bacterium]|nr:VWA domain-containing protein [Myxococcales bacterium]
MGRNVLFSLNAVVLGTLAACNADTGERDERQAPLGMSPGPVAGADGGGEMDTVAHAPGSTGSAPIGGGQPMNAPLPAGDNPRESMAAHTPDNDGACGMIEITPTVEFSPGSLLVIFDRSISMSEPFDATSGTSRLDNAKQAITTALTPLACEDTSIEPDSTPCADTISVSLLTFPTYDGATGLNEFDLSCHVDDLATSEQIDWLGVTEFVDAFEPFWAGRTLVDGGDRYPGQHPLVFGTPISVAFAQADRALADPDVVGNKAVLFLTDGQETGFCQGGADPVAQARSWSQQGVDTHVVSLAPGTGFGQFFNDGVAQAGGTGAAINPQGSAQLTEEISKIVHDARGEITCRIEIDDAKLTDPQQACEEGEVFVQSSKVPCDQDNRSEGFFVQDDTVIEIVGSYCKLLEETMALRAMFPCAVLAPQ